MENMVLLVTDDKGRTAKILASSLFNLQELKAVLSNVGYKCKWKE